MDQVLCFKVVMAQSQADLIHKIFCKSHIKFLEQHRYFKRAVLIDYKDIIVC